MSRPTVLYVLGHVSARAAERGVAILPEDLAVLDWAAEQAGADCEVLMACQDPRTHGFKPRLREIRAERERLLREAAPSEDSGTTTIVAVGGVAASALWDRGSMKVSDYRSRRHTLPWTKRPVFVTWSLEEVAAKHLKEWFALDVQRAVAGEIPVNWGEYVVQQATDGINPELRDFLESGGQRVTVDLETYPGLDPYAPDARIRMAVVSHRAGFAVVVQAGPASELPGWLVDLLRNPNVSKGGSHFRYDLGWFRRFGYDVVNYHCTEHDEHLLDENCRMHDLKSLGLKYNPRLGDYAAGQRALVAERTVRDRKGKEVESGWKFIRDDEMYQYAGGDGDAGIATIHGQAARVEAEGLQRPLAVLREYYPAISDLQLAGACVSRERNAELEELYVGELARLKGEIRGLLGPINPGSPAQLIPALQAHVPHINLRDLFKRRRDEDDSPFSTRAIVLQREARKSPVLGLILEYRRRDALYRFVKGIRKFVTPINGRDYVFSSLRGDIAVTYRHTSSKPNLQNLPRTVEEEAAVGLNVKRQYVSRFEGGLILEADQSQLELREAGMLSEDEALMRAFASGEDVHTYLAALMRQIPIADVTKEIRQDNKSTNFHVLYGGGGAGLAMRLGCDRAWADDLISQFDATFVGYRRWEREQHRLARERGWTESRYGFRRRVEEPPGGWYSKDGRRAMRQAANAPIQGGASITTNLGIVRVLALFREQGLRSVPFLTVHDSLLVDVFPGELERVLQLVRVGMENPETEKYGVRMTIPLMVDCKVGPSWGEMEEVRETI